MALSFPLSAINGQTYTVGAQTWTYSISKSAWLSTPIVPLPIGTPFQTLSAVSLVYSSSTAIIPLDDTVPLVSEGTQLLSQAITISSLSNKVFINVSLPLLASSANGGWVIVSLFRDSVCIDAAAACIAATNYGIPITFNMLDTPTALSHTYSIRIGPGAAATIYINGSVGARFLGGAFVASLILQEIKG